LPFRLYILLDEKTLSTQSIFQKTYCKPPLSSTPDQEGLEALSGTLLERGITTGGLMACKYSPLGTPRGRYDEHSSKSSLSYETKVKSNQ
jgi:hypothetical protein